MALGSKCLPQELKNSGMHSNGWLFLVTAHHFREINKHPLCAVATLFFSLFLSTPSLPFHAIIFFFSPFFFLSGARSSHQLWLGLHGGLRLIAGELKEAGWLHQPSITSLLPHFSIPTSPTEYRLSGLHLAAPRWSRVLFPLSCRHLSRCLPGLFAERLHSGDRP